MKPNLRNRLSAAWLALVHGKVAIIEQPIVVQVQLPAGQRFTPEELRRFGDLVEEHVEFAIEEAQR